MFAANRFSMKSKAALGLLVTVFVAAACSHKNIKDQADSQDQPEVSSQDVPSPDQVIANDAGTFQQDSNTNEVTPAPLSNPEDSLGAPMPSTPISGKKIAHHKHKKHGKHKLNKIARHKAVKKHSRRHKKLKKIAKNHKVKRNKKIDQAAAAMGSINQLPPPPPPSAPVPEMLPPPPPAAPAPNFDSPAMSPVGQSSTGFPWGYTIGGSLIALLGLGFVYRSKFSRKSRRLVFAK